MDVRGFLREADESFSGSEPQAEIIVEINISARL